MNFSSAKKFSVFVFSFIILYQLIGISNIGAINFYQIEWHRTHTNDADGVTLYSPNVSIGQSNVILGARGSFNGSSYTSTVSYYSPFNSLVASSERSFTGNKSCQNFGDVDVNDFETEVRLTSNADEYSITNNVLFQLYPTNKNIHFTMNTYPYDGDGASLNTFFSVKEVSGVTLSQSILNTETINKMNIFSNNFNECYGIYAGNNRYEKSFVTVTAQKYFIHSRFFVFNSSISGEMNYSFDISNSGCVSGLPLTQDFYNVGYYKLNNPVYTNLSISNSGSGSLVLDESTVYVFQVNTGVGTTGSSGSTVIYREHLYNNSVVINSALPVWSCGEWSDCEDGTQQRSCIDTTGEISGKIETRQCFALPSKSISIGFENFTDSNVFYSYPLWFWYAGCAFFMNYKQVPYPNEWQINNVTNPQINNNDTVYTILDNSDVKGFVYDNLKITNEEFYEGVYSLKMWTLPPQSHLPRCKYGANLPDNKTCELTPYGNYTIVNSPRLDKPINETYLLSRNISFDYPNMSISVYIKKCLEPEQEWAGNTSLLGLCNNGYYTNDKSKDWEISDTTLYLQIYDITDSKQITIAGFKASSNDWTKKELLLTNVSIDHLYRFSIGLSPNSAVDTNVYCMYLDNIRINAYSGVFPCSSYCDGVKRYEARKINDYGCVYDVIPVSEICISEIFLDYFSSCSDFCDCDEDSGEYLSYFDGDNSTGECNWKIEQDSDYCEDYCSKQVTEPNKEISDYLEDRGLGFLSNFFSAMFIIIIIVVIIAGYVAHKLDKSWQVFVVVLMILLLIISFLWVDFAFIGIIIVVCLAFFLARTYTTTNNH